VADRSYLSIGQVLDLLKREFPDLTISKIRFLESQGLLDPERTPSGYRKFYEPDIDRLRFILRAQSEHYLPLKVIKGRLGTEGEPDEGEPDEGDDTELEAEVAASAEAPLAAAAEPMAAVAIDTAARLELVGDDGRWGGAPGADHLEETSVSMTLDELAAASGLSLAEVTELERFGLVSGRRVAGTIYYDADCLEIASVAATFRGFGVEARHLRMYKTAVEREAGFFEQVVTPMLKQRNPQARRQAIETLLQLSRLGNQLRAAALRQALREYTGGS
jgi:DNA-binding transcriptional MerR regulator